VIGRVLHPLPAGTGRWRIRWSKLLIAAALIVPVAAASYAAPKKGAVHTVVIDGMQFSPSTLEVHAGDTVIWKNKDPFPHTATSDHPAFDSGSIPSGGSWKFVARKRGRYPYTCTLHKPMKAVLVVE
jgi:plastocyanin